MKNEDFLDLLNEIDEKYIESANKRLEELHQYEDLEFGKALKPQVIRLETPEKKHIPFLTGAFATVAAVLVCAVTVGVFVKLSKPQTVSPNSGVTLSEAPGISEPAVSKPKIDRVERDGYDFSLEIIDGERVSLFSGPFLKTDSEKQIAISLETCRGASEEYPLTIWFLVQEDGTIIKRIGNLIITDKSVKKYTVPYSVMELEQGEECVMQIYSENNVLVRGKILP